MKKTEQKLREAQQELQLTHHRFKCILEGTQDIIAAYDKDFNLLFFNQAFKKEYEGLFRREIGIGMNLIDSLSDLPAEQKK